MSDYPAFPKIPRYFRDVIITEKIDGTNGLISIERKQFGEGAGPTPPGVAVVADPLAVPDECGLPDTELWVRAGSRKRWISMEDDNFGFAAWVWQNAPALAELGTGNHYGEWWGQGIQRGYGLDHKRFSLFNVGRWFDTDETYPSLALASATPIPKVPGLTVVPSLVRGAAEGAVGASLELLSLVGSIAALGAGVKFDKPEGVIIFHTAANAYYKATLEGDGQPKAVAAKAAA